MCVNILYSAVCTVSFVPVVCTGMQHSHSSAGVMDVSCTVLAYMLSEQVPYTQRRVNRAMQHGLLCSTISCTFLLICMYFVGAIVGYYHQNLITSRNDCLSSWPSLAGISLK